MTILEFKIGRGGQFYNGGHLSFEGVSKGISFTSAFDSLFPPKYKNGNDDLRSKNAEWTDGNGNSVELTNAEIKSGIGRIDIDGDYNTVYTTFANELSENEAKLVLAEAHKFNGKYVMSLPIDEIIPEVSIQTIRKAAEANLLFELYDEVQGYAWAINKYDEEDFIAEYLSEEE